MKRLLLFVLGTLPLVAFTQTSSPVPRLTGIVDVEGLKLAIIQASPPRRLEVVFREGQRDGDIEVVTIDSANRAARLAGGDPPRVLVLSNTGSVTNPAGSGLVFEEVTLQTVLNLFAEFSGQTILQHPLLPDMKFSLARTVTNRNEAAQILKNALSEKRIAVVPDGPKFLLVVPEELISTLNPHSAGLATTNTSNAKTEVFPPGSINFTAASLANVLAIYADFLGGKLDRTGAPLRDGKVIFKMPKALTKEECLYAFETLVGWYGIRLVPAGDGMFKAISVAPSGNNPSR